MKDEKNTSSAPVLFISHGGGPLPLLGDEAHTEMVHILKYAVMQFEKPSAILIISAHWEENRPTLTGGAQPALIYDYYGFPKESYEIQYPAPGEPLLAQKILNLLNNDRLNATLDVQRGFDHGLFVPLKIMYPDADIPCVQLSLIKELNPTAHIKMGEALAGLQGENILVLGSGFSFHNLRAFFSQDSNESQAKNQAFEKWLIETCTSHELNEDERTHRLINWENAPAARYCHPREEHLLPLHVCYGLTQRPAKEVMTFHVMGKKASAYLW